ncbi:flagellar protein FlaG [Aneurinibacillus sp. BA2021]|nr:flagellar protein FlaG [Aneurinibacillus sp. BA2021]
MSDLSIQGQSSLLVKPFKSEASSQILHDSSVSSAVPVITQQASETNDQREKYSNEKEREKLKEEANALFDVLDTGLALKFHDKSGQWYAVIENKITHEVIKEVPPKEMLELRARLKKMIGFFIDQKI